MNKPIYYLIKNDNGIILGVTTEPTYAKFLVKKVLGYEPILEEIIFLKKPILGEE